MSPLKGTQPIRTAHFGPTSHWGPNSIPGLLSVQNYKRHHTIPVPVMSGMQPGRWDRSTPPGPMSEPGSPTEENSWGLPTRGYDEAAIWETTDGGHIPAGRGLFCPPHMISYWSATSRKKNKPGPTWTTRIVAGPGKAGFCKLTNVDHFLVQFFTKNSTIS